MTSINNSRILYLDSLRLFILIMVISYHSAMIYGLPQSFYYHELAPDFLTKAALSFFVSINQSYFMGLLFFIAGYFTPASYQRRGVLNFLVTKSIQIIPPVVIFAFFINPFLFYLGDHLNTNIITYYSNLYSNIFHNLNIIHPGPLWFIQTLLIFYFGYAFIKIFINKYNLFSNKIKKNRLIITIQVICLVIISSFIIRIFFPIGKVFLNFTIPYLPQHISMFVIGILTFNNKWMRFLSKLHNKIFYLPVIFICLWPIILFPSINQNNYIDLLRGGFHWQSLLYTIWETLTGVGISLYVLRLFYLNEKLFQKITLIFARDNYAIYIVHAPIITIIGLSFQYIHLMSILKFFLVTIISIILSFILSHLCFTNLINMITFRNKQLLPHL
jgi:glucans biosynthesis protein C